MTTPEYTAAQTIAAAGRYYRDYYLNRFRGWPLPAGPDLADMIQGEHHTLGNPPRDFATDPPRPYSWMDDDPLPPQ